MFTEHTHGSSSFQVYCKNAAAMYSLFTTTRQDTEHTDSEYKRIIHQNTVIQAVPDARIIPILLPHPIADNRQLFRIN